MATYSKPTSIPRWADVSGTITEPPSGKKDVGWVFEDVPPAAYENWLQYTTGEWFKWIDERLNDGVTNDFLSIASPGLIHTGSTGMNIHRGLAVGWATTAPADDIVSVGDSNFRMDFTTPTDPAVYFDVDNYIVCDRVADTITWVLGTAAEMFLTADGLQIGNGLVVGTGVAPWDDDIRATGGINCGGSTNPAAGDGIFTNGITVGFDAAPLADQVQIGDADFRLNLNGALPRVIFDTNDFIQYSRAGDTFSFQIASTVEAEVDATGVGIENGLYVGSATGTRTDNDIYADGGINCGGSTNPAAGDGIFTNGIRVGQDLAPVTDRVIVGDGDFYMSWNGSNGFINFDANDLVIYDRSNNWYNFQIASVTEVRVASDGLKVANGLYVGDATGSAVDNDIIAEGGINCGGSTNPNNGAGIFTHGLQVGDDSNPAAAGRIDAGNASGVRGVLSLYDGNLTGTLTPGSDNAYLYARSISAEAELWVNSASGGGTQLTSHDSQTGEWIHRNDRMRAGQRFTIWIEKAIRELEVLTGKTFIETEDLPIGDMAEYLEARANDSGAPGLFEGTRAETLDQRRRAGLPLEP